MTDLHPTASHPIRQTAAELRDGDRLILDNNTVIHGKHASFQCTLPPEGLGDGLLRLGHGLDCYSATYLEITATHLRVFHYYTQLDMKAEFAHELSLSTYLTVHVDVNYSRATIAIASAGGVYRVENVSWCGRQGEIFAQPIGVNLQDVRFNWLCDRYKRDIWLFGDSYFNTESHLRWPYYLCKDGFAAHFMTGYPGMGCQRALTDFQLALTRGTPTFAVWCMGMNNGDTSGEVSAVYRETTAEFLRLCRVSGITPILTTIPTTPIVENRYKNAWVTEQNVRYIDFARAVGGHVPTEGTLGKRYTLPNGTEAVNKTGYEWYPGMLYGDLVHPDTAGAHALYMQVLADFPEIMQI